MEMNIYRLIAAEHHHPSKAIRVRGEVGPTATQ